jgi:hypothetical protein
MTFRQTSLLKYSARYFKKRNKTNVIVRTRVLVKKRQTSLKYYFKKIRIVKKRPKKVRTSKKNRLLLSRTATALFETTSLSRGICNRIGQYLGTDIEFFQKGDMYAYAFEYMNRQPMSVQVSPEFRGVHRQIRWMEGKKIYTYKVVRRTACMLLVEPVALYCVFLRWRGNKQEHRVFDAREIIGVAKEDVSYYATRREKPWFRGMQKLIDEVNGFKIVQKIESMDDIEYNPETDQLDIECGRANIRHIRKHGINWI